VLSFKHFKKAKTRILASLLVGVFLWDTVAGSAPGGLSLVPAHSPQNSQIEIPESMGSVTERFLSEPRIIYIQDAHAHPEAQRNIQAILEHLASKGRIQQVAVEGAAGKIDPGVFDFFSLPEVNLALAEELVDMGELTGAELFSLKQKSPSVPLYGVEDMDLYSQSFLLFRQIKSRKAEIYEALSRYQKKLEQNEIKRFNPDLRDFVQSLRDWEGRENSFSHFTRLRDLAKKYLELDLSDAVHQFEWPYLTRIIKIAEKETRFNPELIRSELEGLIREVNQKLPAGKTREKILEGLNKLSDDKTAASFKGLRRFFETLYHEAIAHNIVLLEYPRFLAWAGTLILREEIDASRLFKEMKILGVKLEKKLVRTEGEKQLLQISKDFSLLKRLLDLQLTREDYEIFRQRKSKLIKNFSLIPIDLLEKAEAFYQFSRQRDETLLQNTLEQAKTTALIAGGFHSQGLTEQLKAKQIPYVVIAPRMTRLEDEGLYERVMMGKNALVRALILYFLGNYSEHPEIFEEWGMAQDVKAVLSRAMRAELQKRNWPADRIEAALNRIGSVILRPAGPKDLGPRSFASLKMTNGINDRAEVRAAAPDEMWLAVTATSVWGLSAAYFAWKLWNEKKRQHEAEEPPFNVEEAFAGLSWIIANETTSLSVLNDAKILRNELKIISKNWGLRIPVVDRRPQDLNEEDVKTRVTSFLNKHIPRAEVRSELDHVFEQMVPPPALKQILEKGSPPLILSPEEKSAIYREARKIFEKSGLTEALTRAGVNAFALYVVSGMAPGRIAVARHSDLDLTLAIQVDSQEQFRKAVQEMQTVKGLDYMETTDLGRFVSIVRFKLPSELSALGAEDTLDVNVRSLQPVPGEFIDRDNFTLRLFDLGAPMEILSSRNFDPKEEKQKLTDYLLKEENSSGYKSLEELAQALRNFWVELLAVDYYHLNVAGIDVKQLGSPVPPVDLTVWAEGLKQKLAAHADLWSLFEQDMKKYYQDTRQFLNVPRNREIERKFHYHTAHRELGNFKQIQDRLGRLQDKITAEKILEALTYYKGLKDNAGFTVPMGVLMKEIRENPKAQFGDLPGEIIFYLFTANPQVIQQEFGISRELLVLGLLVDLLESRRAEARTAIEPFDFYWPNDRGPVLTLKGMDTADAFILNYIRVDDPRLLGRQKFMEIVPFLIAHAKEKHSVNPFPLEIHNVVNPHSLHIAHRLLDPATLEYSDGKIPWAPLHSPGFNLYETFGPLVIRDEGHPYTGKSILISRGSEGYFVTSQPKGINIKIRGDRVIVRDVPSGDLLQNVNFQSSFKLRGKLREPRAEVRNALSNSLTEFLSKHKTAEINPRKFVRADLVTEFLAAIRSVRRFQESNAEYLRPSSPERKEIAREKFRDDAAKTLNAIRKLDHYLTGTEEAGDMDLKIDVNLLAGRIRQATLSETFAEHDSLYRLDLELIQSLTRSLLTESSQAFGKMFSQKGYEAARVGVEFTLNPVQGTARAELFLNEGGSRLIQRTWNLDPRLVQSLERNQIARITIYPQAFLKTLDLRGYGVLLEKLLDFLFIEGAPWGSYSVFNYMHMKRERRSDGFSEIILYRDNDEMGVRQNWRDYLVAPRRITDPRSFWNNQLGEGPLELEIGPGRGEYLLARSKELLENGGKIVGMEIPVPISDSGEVLREKLIENLKNLEGKNFLPNLRIVLADATTALRQFFDEGQLSRIYLFFPSVGEAEAFDSTDAVLWRNLLSRLAPGGELHIVTDFQDYGERLADTLKDFQQEGELENIAVQNLPAKFPKVYQSPFDEKKPREAKVYLKFTKRARTASGPTAGRQARGEVRAAHPTVLAEYQKQMMAPGIYPRYWLQEAPKEKYKTHDLEKSVDPLKKEDEKFKVFVQSVIRNLERALPKSSEVLSMKEHLNIILVDTPRSFFYDVPAGQPHEIGQFMQISYRRRAIFISRKFLEVLDPTDRINRALVAYALMMAQHLIEFYYAKVDEFKLVETSRPEFPNIFAAIYKKIDEEMREGTFAVSVLDAFKVHGKQLNDRLEGLQNMGSSVEQVMLRDLQKEEGMVAQQIGAIDKIFRAAEKEHEDPEELAMAVKQKISEKFYAKKDKGEMTEAFSIRIIKELINEIEKIAFYSQAQGDFRRAGKLYSEILRLQKYLQRIDTVGFLPFRIQREIVYFLLRIGDMKRFEEEFDRLIFSAYVPANRLSRELSLIGVDEKGVLGPGPLSAWFEGALPDMLLKLQLYESFFKKSSAERRTLLKIRGIEEKLIDRLWEVRLAGRFDANLTFPPAEDSLQNSFRVPVLEGDEIRQIMGFVWEKKEEKPGLIRARVRAFPDLAGGETAEAQEAGHFHFYLERDKAGNWTAFADPGRKTWNEPGPLFVDPATSRQIRGVDRALLLLAVRLAKESGADKFDLSTSKLKVKFQGVESSSLGDLQKSQMLRDPIRKMPIQLRVRPPTQKAPGSGERAAPGPTGRQARGEVRAVEPYEVELEPLDAEGNRWSAKSDRGGVYHYQLRPAVLKDFKDPRFLEMLGSIYRAPWAQQNVLERLSSQFLKSDVLILENTDYQNLAGFYVYIPKVKMLDEIAVHSDYKATGAADVLLEHLKRNLAGRDPGALLAEISRHSKTAVPLSGEFRREKDPSESPVQFADRAVQSLKEALGIQSRVTFTSRAEVRSAEIENVVVTGVSPNIPQIVEGEIFVWDPEKAKRINIYLVRPHDTPKEAHAKIENEIQALRQIWSDIRKSLAAEFSEETLTHSDIVVEEAVGRIKNQQEKSEIALKRILQGTIQATTVQTVIQERLTPAVIQREELVYLHEEVAGMTPEEARARLIEYQTELTMNRVFEVILKLPYGFYSEDEDVIKEARDIAWGRIRQFVDPDLGLIPLLLKETQNGKTARHALKTLLESVQPIVESLQAKVQKVNEQLKDKPDDKDLISSHTFLLRNLETTEGQLSYSQAVEQSLDRDDYVYEFERSPEEKRKKMESERRRHQEVFKKTSDYFHSPTTLLSEKMKEFKKFVEVEIQKGRPVEYATAKFFYHQYRDNRNFFNEDREIMDFLMRYYDIASHGEETSEKSIIAFTESIANETDYNDLRGDLRRHGRIVGIMVPKPEGMKKWRIPHWSINAQKELVPLPFLDLEAAGIQASDIKTGSKAIVDGKRGEVVINPSPEKRQEMMEKGRIYKHLDRYHEANAKEPVFIAGRPFFYWYDESRRASFMDVEGPKGKESPVSKRGGRGIALLRLEDLIGELERAGIEWDEGRLSFAVSEILSYDYFERGAPLVIRLFDVAPDKRPRFVTQGSWDISEVMRHLTGVRFYLSPEEKYQEFREFGKMQLRALFAAHLSKFGGNKNLHILFSDVRTPVEIHAIENLIFDAKVEFYEKATIDENLRGLRRLRDVPAAIEQIPIGYLIEHTFTARENLDSLLKAIEEERINKPERKRSLGIGSNDLMKSIREERMGGKGAITLLNSDLIQDIWNIAKKAKEKGIEVTLEGEWANTIPMLFVLATFRIYEDLDIIPGAATHRVPELLTYARNLMTEDLETGIAQLKDPKSTEKSYSLAELILQALDEKNPPSPEALNEAATVVAERIERRIISRPDFHQFMEQIEKEEEKAAAPRAEVRAMTLKRTEKKDKKEIIEITVSAMTKEKEWVRVVWNERTKILQVIFSLKDQFEATYPGKVATELTHRSIMSAVDDDRIHLLLPPVRKVGIDKVQAPQRVVWNDPEALAEVIAKILDRRTEAKRVSHHAKAGKGEVLDSILGTASLALSMQDALEEARTLITEAERMETEERNKQLEAAEEKLNDARKIAEKENLPLSPIAREYRRIESLKQTPPRAEVRAIAEQEFGDAADLIERLSKLFPRFGGKPWQEYPDENISESEIEQNRQELIRQVVTDIKIIQDLLSTVQPVSFKEVVSKMASSNLLSRDRITRNLPVTYIFRGDLVPDYQGEVKPRFIVITLGGFKTPKEVPARMKAKIRGEGQKALLTEDFDLGKTMYDKNPWWDVWADGGKVVFAADGPRFIAVNAIFSDVRDEKDILAKGGTRWYDLSPKSQKELTKEEKDIKRRDKDMVIKQWVASSISAGALLNFYLAGPDMFMRDEDMELMVREANQVQRRLKFPYKILATTSRSLKFGSFNHRQWMVTSIGVVESFMEALRNDEIRNHFDIPDRVGIIIPGFGDVGTGIIRFLLRKYSKELKSGKIFIEGVSNIDGGIYRKGGLDLKELERLVKLWREKGDPLFLQKEYQREKENVTKDEILFKGSTIVIPAGPPDMVKTPKDIRRLKRAGTKMYVEGGNNTYRPNTGLEKVFHDEKILLLSGDDINGGGVFASMEEVYHSWMDGRYVVRFNEERPDNLDNRRIHIQTQIMDIASANALLLFREFFRLKREVPMFEIKQKIIKEIRAHKRDLLIRPTQDLDHRIDIDIERGIPPKFARLLNAGEIAREEALFENENMGDLIRELQTPTNLSNLRFAIYVLGKKQVQGAAKELINILAKKTKGRFVQSLLVRRAAAEALGHLGTMGNSEVLESAMRVLESVRKNEKEPIEVRAWAQWTLDKITDTERAEAAVASRSSSGRAEVRALRTLDQDKLRESLTIAARSFLKFHLWNIQMDHLQPYYGFQLVYEPPPPGALYQDRARVVFKIVRFKTDKAGTLAQDDKNHLIVERVLDSMEWATTRKSDPDYGIAAVMMDPHASRKQGLNWTGINFIEVRFEGAPVSIADDKVTKDQVRENLAQRVGNLLFYLLMAREKGDLKTLYSLSTYSQPYWVREHSTPSAPPYAHRLVIDPRAEVRVASGEREKAIQRELKKITAPPYEKINRILLLPPFPTSQRKLGWILREEEGRKGWSQQERLESLLNEELENKKLEIELEIPPKIASPEFIAGLVKDILNSVKDPQAGPNPEELSQLRPGLVYLVAPGDTEPNKRIQVRVGLIEPGQIFVGGRPIAQITSIEDRDLAQGIQAVNLEILATEKVDRIVDAIPFNPWRKLLQFTFKESSHFNPAMMNQPIKDIHLLRYTTGLPGDKMELLLTPPDYVEPVLPKMEKTIPQAPAPQAAGRSAQDEKKLIDVIEGLVPEIRKVFKLSGAMSSLEVLEHALAKPAADAKPKVIVRYAPNEKGGYSIDSKPHPILVNGKRAPLMFALFRELTKDLKIGETQNLDPQRLKAVNDGDGFGPRIVALYRELIVPPAVTKAPKEPLKERQLAMPEVTKEGPEQSFEKQWNALLGLEKELESFRSSFKMLIDRLNKLWGMQLSGDDKIYAVSGDVTQWEDRKKQLQFKIPDLQKFLNKLNAGEPAEMKRLEEIYENYIKSKKAFPQINEELKALEGIRKKRQVLLDEGRRDYAGAQAVASEIQNALNVIKQNAAKAKLEKRSEVRGQVVYPESLSDRTIQVESYPLRIIAGKLENQKLVRSYNSDGSYDLTLKPRPAGEKGNVLVIDIKSGNALIGQLKANWIEGERLDEIDLALNEKWQGKRIYPEIFQHEIKNLLKPGMQVEGEIGNLDTLVHLTEWMVHHDPDMPADMRQVLALFFRAFHLVERSGGIEKTSLAGQWAPRLVKALIGAKLKNRNFSIPSEEAQKTRLGKLWNRAGVSGVEIVFHPAGFKVGGKEALGIFMSGKVLPKSEDEKTPRAEVRAFSKVEINEINKNSVTFHDQELPAVRIQIVQEGETYFAGSNQMRGRIQIKPEENVLTFVIEGQRLGHPAEDWHGLVLLGGKDSFEKAQIYLIRAPKQVYFPDLEDVDLEVIRKAAISELQKLDELLKEDRIFKDLLFDTLQSQIGPPIFDDLFIRAEDTARVKDRLKILPSLLSDTDTLNQWKQGLVDRLGKDLGQGIQQAKEKAELIDFLRKIQTERRKGAELLDRLMLHDARLQKTKEPGSEEEPHPRAEVRTELKAIRPIKTILIADDEEGIRKALKGMLKLSFGEEVEILEATNPQEAISLAQKEGSRIGLVITNWNMWHPNDGNEVVEGVREISETQNLPIIIFSGDRITLRPDWKNIVALIKGDDPEEFYNHLDSLNQQSISLSQRAEVRTMDWLVEGERKIRLVLREEGRGLQEFLGTAESAHRFVEPAFYSHAPYLQFVLFGVVPPGLAVVGGGVSVPAFQMPARTRSIPRVVALIPVNGKLPQVNLRALQMGQGSQVIIYTKDLKSFDEYSSLRIPGVQFRRVKFEGELPKPSEIREQFAHRPEALPLLFVPSEIQSLNSFQSAADRDGFVIRMPHSAEARESLVRLISQHEVVKNLIGKLPEKILEVRFNSGALSPVFVPFQSENEFITAVGAYLAEMIRARLVEVAA